MKILAQDVRIRSGYSALPRKIDITLKNPKNGKVRTAVWNKYTVINVNRVAK